MARGVDTEAVNAHLDELAVAFHEIFCNGVVLGVEIDAVACYLTPPAVGVVPVPAGGVVVVVVVVVVLRLLEIFEACRILLFARQIVVVGRQTVVVRDDGSRYRRLVLDVLAACEEGVEICLSKVSCVVEHDVKDNLHAFGVGSIDEALECDIL